MERRTSVEVAVTWRGDEPTPGTFSRGTRVDGSRAAETVHAEVKYVAFDDGEVGLAVDVDSVA